MRRLLCFAQGIEGDWEAACPDLDIAVQGRSYEEVYDLLNTAIQDYVEAALQEDRITRKRLLNRKAPLLVRVSHILGFLRAAWASRDDRLRHGFTVPCAA
jgi:predicted RNase H-like HicB family nuclease